MGNSELMVYDDDDDESRLKKNVHVNAKIYDYKSVLRRKYDNGKIDHYYLHYKGEIDRI